MSSRLPAVSSKELVKLLELKGFVKVRQSGSHAIYRNTSGKRTTIPLHSGKIIGKGLLKQIMKDTDINPEELRKK